MDNFEGVRAWCCGEADSCGAQVVTIVLGEAGVQRPMCLEHLAEHLVSLGQRIRLDR